MSACTFCGASVLWKKTRGGGRVAVDPHEVAGGESRYLERDEGLVPVSAKWPGMAFQDHSVTCPKRDAGSSMS